MEIIKKISIFKFIFLLVLILSASNISHANDNAKNYNSGIVPPLPGDLKEEIKGSWRYVGYIYDEISYPLPNGSLFLTFTFDHDNRVKLYWKRADEDYFCERSAKYVIEEDTLSQEVDWVNPDNHFSCGSDPDMQLGRKTQNIFSINENQLKLVLELSGKPFFYLLNRISK